MTTPPSQLFSRDTAVRRFMSDRFPSIARYLGSAPSTDYVWEKLLAAEADARRELHVFFAPTKLFPDTPTEVDIAALNGAAWEIDPGYDYDNDLLQPGGWSFIPLRQKPVVSIESIKFNYPTTGVLFEVPAKWIKLDRKYGHVRFIPAGGMFAMPAGGFLGAMGAQGAPQFIEVRYTAGLSNAAADYPDLLDLVQRMAMLRLLNDAMPAASGSISADGLSQSISPPDADKIQAGIDKLLETLRQRLHGVPLMVL